MPKMLFRPEARLFIGLWPDDAVRDAILAHADEWRWPPRVTRTRGERLHLTLHFLGNVARDRLPALTEGLAVELRVFEIRLGRPDLWAGGIAVLRPHAVPDELSALHVRLGAALNRLGLPPSGEPFQPHVTLARRARGALAPGSRVDISWRVGGYALIESDPVPLGGYRTLASYGAY